MTHDLYKTADPDRPDVICDRNGEVVLGLCKRCNKAEIELSEPCIPDTVAFTEDAKAFVEFVLRHTLPARAKERTHAETYSIIRFHPFAKKFFPQ